MSTIIKIAGVQMESRLADTAGNLARCVEMLGVAAAGELTWWSFPRRR